jgi:hypothetical protein
MNGLVGRLKNECMKIFESEKDQLKKSLREADSISLTTDLWTSNQNIQYMCLVAHYIDANWVLQCRVLNFFELDPPHSGLYMDVCPCALYCSRAPKAYSLKQHLQLQVYNKGSSVIY